MIASLSTSFADWKRSRGLMQPGSYDSLHKEVKNVILSNLVFEGGKADLAKGLSPNFQVAHSFSLGTAGAPSLYHFGAVYVQGKHLLHGMLDSQGAFQGKYHYTLSDRLMCKFQAHMVPSQQQTMLQSEAEYTGQDFTLNAKAINPDAARATGIYTLSYLQSLSKQVAVGGEAVAQRMGSKDPVDYGLNAVARISGADWVATATMQQLVALQLSFWQRVSDKVELGSELQLLNAGQYRREAITSIAAKFDYKQCSIRVQADSQFKVALFMEERIFPGFSLLLSGELDHLKGTNRFGLGVNLEN